MPPPKNAFSVVPLSTIERVKRNVNPDDSYGVSDSQQIERQYLRTLSKQRSDKWPNTLDVRAPPARRRHAPDRRRRGSAGAARLQG